MTRVRNVGDKHEKNQLPDFQRGGVVGKFQFLLLGFLLSGCLIPTFAQAADAQIGDQALKAKIGQIVLDESSVKMHATLTMDMKGYIELQTKFENLRPALKRGRARKDLQKETRS